MLSSTQSSHPNPQPTLSSFHLFCFLIFRIHPRSSSDPSRLPQFYATKDLHLLSQPQGEKALSYPGGSHKEPSCWQQRVSSGGKRTDKIRGFHPLTQGSPSQFQHDKTHLLLASSLSSTTSIFIGIGTVLTTCSTQHTALSTRRLHRCSLPYLTNKVRHRTENCPQ